MTDEEETRSSSSLSALILTRWDDLLSFQIQSEQQKDSGFALPRCLVTQSLNSYKNREAEGTARSLGTTEHHRRPNTSGVWAHKHTGFNGRYRQLIRAVRVSHDALLHPSFGGREAPKNISESILYMFYSRDTNQQQREDWWNHKDKKNLFLMQLPQSESVFFCWVIKISWTKLASQTQREPLRAAFVYMHTDISCKSRPYREKKHTLW